MIESDARGGLYGGRTLVSTLTVFAVLVHGYHPYAEDGGVYLAGVKRLLDPTLYGANPVFVLAPMRYSLFAPMMAGLVRVAHVPLMWMMAILYVATIWMTLYAAWRIATQVFASTEGKAGAMMLLACWLTLPIAGTSLMLMDPYVTARSFSAPLVLLAIGWALKRRFVWSLASLMTAAALHPLMAGYGGAAVALIVCWGLGSRKGRVWGSLAMGAAALTLALVLQWRAPIESAEMLRIAQTRYYWFPLRWEWYEQAGLIAPLLLILWLGAKSRERARFVLTGAMLSLGLIALLVAALFAYPRDATQAVARLQPLRAFQLVYVAMILLLGGYVGEHWMRRSAWRWCALAMACAGAMFVAERQTYPASAHLEMPWRRPANAWEQAFVWVRENTPRDALFALDARYITRGKGEDAQCFRVIAERDTLADYSKDGGEAAIAPQLTTAWARGEKAQEGLERESDALRAAKLRPAGVSWIVLEAASATAWVCPYANAAVKVCRLP